ncbi:MAG: hypothetical protein A2660_00810 [Candidatus Doudnabacteria bacterium RIFCSPHIGHO2_01_FULL_45_18]|uniref:General secretion pathway GspH domain-containing protein n=1 Tax=Candidatus Doudnabacteria bacterium RIFCSPHIGHO2_01_FULL_45_18 TaxID=1817823 RepID=A0A1F5NSI1_9BACT|nr:MAG: hypothetical protein A2660_00810 [Candidatus Doudnabacteria bacterium RIFCSPHIGHO2_01_FULL_45_18]
MKQRGFTLIELLVVVFLITLISGISIANFRSGEKRRAVALASDTVISAIRTAQNYALTGKKTNNANGACRSAEFYWIEFAYATPTAMTLSAENTCGSVDLIETYILPARSQIRAGGLSLNGSAAITDLSIIFYPPFGTLEAMVDDTGSTSPVSFTTATIIVETSEGDISKSITIDGVAGRIGE